MLGQIANMRCPRPVAPPSVLPLQATAPRRRRACPSPFHKLTTGGSAKECRGSDFPSSNHPANLRDQIDFGEATFYKPGHAGKRLPVQFVLRSWPPGNAPVQCDRMKKGRTPRYQINEAHLSTLETRAEAPSRLPRPHGDQGGPWRDRRAPQSRSQAALGLTEDDDRPPFWIEARKAAQAQPVSCSAAGREAAWTAVPARSAETRRRRAATGRLHRHQEDRKRREAQSHPSPAEGGGARSCCR